jgi:endogenous inhibitor of DNA gyrase (YacG/DUF329 family)
MVEKVGTEETGKEAACSICGKPVDPKYKPFCSRRCANVDLNRWLNGAYSIAGEKLDDETPGNGQED